MKSTDKKKLETIAHRMREMATFYLRHTSLENVKPADAAALLNFEAREIIAVVEGQPTH